MRRKAKRDLVETDIVRALRAAGATVAYLNGEDIPDLLVGIDGKNYLIENKTGKRKLRPGQQKWHNEWRGQVIVCRTIEEALRAIGR